MFATLATNLIVFASDAAHAVVEHAGEHAAEFDKMANVRMWAAITVFLGLVSMVTTVSSSDNDHTPEAH